VYKAKDPPKSNAWARPGSAVSLSLLFPRLRLPCLDEGIHLNLDISLLQPRLASFVFL
jgi:hypothetical protein